MASCSSTVGDDVSLDDFKLWKADDLRLYIRLRGQPSSAERKNELVATAYAIYQQRLPIVMSAQELKAQYKYV